MTPDGQIIPNVPGHASTLRHRQCHAPSVAFLPSPWRCPCRRPDAEAAPSPDPRQCATAWPSRPHRGGEPGAAFAVALLRVLRMPGAGPPAGDVLPARPAGPPEHRPVPRTGGPGREPERRLRDGHSILGGGWAKAEPAADILPGHPLGPGGPDVAPGGQARGRFEPPRGASPCAASARCGALDAGCSGSPVAWPPWPRRCAAPLPRLIPRRWSTCIARHSSRVANVALDEYGQVYEAGRNSWVMGHGDAVMLTVTLLA
jgi:hypothetical protein